MLSKQSTSGFEESKTFDHLSVGVQAFLPATLSSCWPLQASSQTFKDIKHLPPKHHEETQIEISHFIVYTSIYVWEWKGLDNQYKNFVHVNPTFNNCDIAVVLEPFILKLFKALPAPNGLNVYSNCSTVGSIHQSVVQKTFPGVSLGNSFARRKSCLFLFSY